MGKYRAKYSIGDRVKIKYPDSQISEDRKGVIIDMMNYGFGWVYRVASANRKRFYPEDKILRRSDEN